MDLIKPSWLRMFTAEELRTLISGEDKIDLKDLRANTVYSGLIEFVYDYHQLATHNVGYSEKHPVIQWLWEILESFNSKHMFFVFSAMLCNQCSVVAAATDRSAFLRFCTSVSRGPLLGFSSLQPRLCIQLVPVPDEAAAAQLPTS